MVDILVGHAGVEGAVLDVESPVWFVCAHIPGSLGQFISPRLFKLLHLLIITSITAFADEQAVSGAGNDHRLGLQVLVRACQPKVSVMKINLYRTQMTKQSESSYCKILYPVHA